MISKFGVLGKVVFCAAAAAGALAAPTLTLAAPLTMAVGGAITTVDPHFYSTGPNNSVSKHIFDMLTRTTGNLDLEPSLAESWSAVDDLTWEFKLRPGVTFHNGAPFTADDVAFTLSRARNVPNSPGGFGGYLKSITKVEVVDPLTIRLHTAKPTPNLPRDMAFVAIVSKAVGENATTEDYNSGKAAVGTGPYVFSSYTPGDRIELTRNDKWWGKPQAWEKVTLKIINNPGARIAALLSGGVDVIDAVPASDLPRLKENKNVTVSSIEGVRVIFLQPDFSHDSAVPGVTDLKGAPLKENPFRDLRVRRALSIAINRDGLADRVMQGTAAPTGQWLPKGNYSYAESIQPPKYDVALAKSLLTEAGYPDGFALTLLSPNDRYPNDASTAQAVASMWARIGVKTNVDAVPWSTYTARRAKNDFGISLIGWGSGTGEAGQLLINVLGTYDQANGVGASNAGRYSNKKLDALREQALSTIDVDAREKVLIQAVEVAMNDVAMIPMYMLRNYWGVRNGLTFEPRKDEHNLAMSVRPAN